MSKPTIYTAIIVALLIAGGAWWGVTQYNNTNGQVVLKTKISNTNSVANVNANSNEVIEYRDPSGRYLFSASKAWIVTKIQDNKAGFELVPNNGSSSRIYINAIDNTSDLSIEKLFDSFNDTSRFWFTKYPHQTSTVNGRTIEHFPAFQEDPSQPYRVEKMIQGNMIVGLASYQYFQDDFGQEFDKVVNSFKFL